MRTKTFEVRDRHTFIPVLAVDTRSDDPLEHWLLRRAGYDNTSDCVILIRMECKGINGNASYDPFAWNATGTRTMHVAHQYIQEHWDTLNSGDVICVEHILGERTEPKKSERLEYP